MDLERRAPATLSRESPRNILLHESTMQLDAHFNRHERLCRDLEPETVPISVRSQSDRMRDMAEKVSEIRSSPTISAQVGSVLKADANKGILQTEQDPGIVAATLELNKGLRAGADKEIIVST